MRTRLRTMIFGAALVAASATAFGTYNANLSGIVTAVATYTDSDHVLFRLDNQPASHPACNANYFVIPAETPSDRRKAILSRLLLAKATGEPITVGYDGTGACSSGYIQAYRVG